MSEQEAPELRQRKATGGTNTAPASSGHIVQPGDVRFSNFVGD